MSLFASLAAVQALEEKLQNIVPTHRVGPVLFCTDPLKLALVLEAQHWKEAYGKSVPATCRSFYSNSIAA